MWWSLECHPSLGTWSATQACALIGNRTGNPLVRRPALNPLRHTSQGKNALALNLRRINSFFQGHMSKGDYINTLGFHIVKLTLLLFFYLWWDYTHFDCTSLLPVLGSIWVPARWLDGYTWSFSQNFSYFNCSLNIPRMLIKRNMQVW